MTWTHERQRISTGLQTQGDYIGRQTRVTRETQLEPLKQWLSNKMGGDRQSTWEHMAPNKQQAMCSTHRDIWWPAWAHQQDRDNKQLLNRVITLRKLLLNRIIKQRSLNIYFSLKCEQYVFIATDCHILNVSYLYRITIFAFHSFLDVNQ